MPAEPPDHIAPACPMPETTGEKSHKQIKIPSYPPAPVPSQRNIDIIPEPGTQRYMPPVPEVGNAHCKVRRVEIFHEIKPHNSLKYFGFFLDNLNKILQVFHLTVIDNPFSFLLLAFISETNYTGQLSRQSERNCYDTSPVKKGSFNAYYMVLRIAAF